MEAIALSAPDGTVYAYACGRCHQVRANSHYMHAHDPAEVAYFAESYRADAERCCQCRHCGGFAGHFAEQPEHGTCAACYERLRPEREANEARWAAEREKNAREREAALALATDRDAALGLEHAISDISEETHCAGWLIGIEHTLWDMMQEGGDHPFGMGTVSAADLAELRRLSDKAGGWWRFDRFMPRAAWLDHHLTRRDGGTSGG